MRRAQVKVYTLAQDVQCRHAVQILERLDEMIVAHPEVYYMHWYSLRKNCVTLCWYATFHLVINGP